MGRRRLRAVVVLPIVAVLVSLAGACSQEASQEDTGSGPVVEPVPDVPEPVDTDVTDVLETVTDTNVDPGVTLLKLADPETPGCLCMPVGPCPLPKPGEKPDGEEPEECVFPCKCPKSILGWCEPVSDQVVIKALAEAGGEGVKGIKQLKLFYTPDPLDPGKDEKLVTQKFADKEGYFDLSFSVIEKEKFLQGDDEAAKDGEYKLAIEAESDTGATKRIKASIYLDRTGPALKLYDSVGPEEPEPDKIDVSLDGKTFVGRMPAAGCALDLGSGVKELKFAIGDKEIEPKAGAAADKTCLSELAQEYWVFDVSAFGEPGEFKMLAEDCQGNTSALSKQVEILGPPRFKSPPFIDIPNNLGVGSVLQLHAAHFVDAARAGGEDPYPDLLIVGSTGIGIAVNDEVGGFQPVELLIPAPDARDALLHEVNGDKALDLIVLVGEPTASHVEIYLQRTVVDPEFPTEWNPTWSFLEWKPVLDEKGEPVLDENKKEVKQLVPVTPEVYPGVDDYFIGSVTAFRLANLNPGEDDLMDLLLIGGNENMSAETFVHTGKVFEPPKPPPEQGRGEADIREEDVEVVEDPGPDTWFAHRDTLTGVSAILDYGVGDFNGDGLLDIVFVSENGAIATASVSSDGTANIGKVSSTCYGMGSASRVVVDDLVVNSSGLDDLVVYLEDNKVAYVMRAESDGSGYFDSTCGMVALDDWAEIFGQEHVAGAASLPLVGDMFKCGEFLCEAGVFTPMVVLGEVPWAMVLADVVGTPGDPGLDGFPDLVATIPALNRLAIYRGRDDGTLQDAMFLIPGKSPKALLVEDVDLDNVPDFIMSIDDGVRIALLLSKPSGGTCGWDCDNAFKFKATLEIPMPVSTNWTTGARLVPTFMAVGDLDNDLDQDIVVTTAPERQTWQEPEAPCDPAVWTGFGSGPGFTDQAKALPLVLAYLFQDGVPVDPLGHPSMTPYKSVVDVELDTNLTGMVLGKFNQDQFPDVAISTASPSEEACSGRSFDILVGAQQVAGIVCPTMLGTVKTALSYYTTKFGPGYFAPMGGYQGPRVLTGLDAAMLDSDDLTDLVLIAGKQGEPKDETFQWHTVAAYMTRFDDKWNSCIDKNVNTTWFDCAPPFPIQMAEFLPQCNEEAAQGDNEPGEPAGDGEEEPTEEPTPVTCIPEFGEDPIVCGSLDGALHVAALQETHAENSKVLSEPVAVVIADFDGEGTDYACKDVVAANAAGDMTYAWGVCENGGYRFYEENELYAIGPNAADLKVADLDNDYYPDVIAALDGKLSLVYSDYEGTAFDYPCYIAPESLESFSPSSVVVQDVNDDGKVDLLVTEATKDSVLVFLNAGAADAAYRSKRGKATCRVKFIGALEVPVGLEPKSIAVQDMDGDGCSDLVVMNQGSQSVVILFSAWCD